MATPSRNRPSTAVLQVPGAVTQTVMLWSVPLSDRCLSVLSVCLSCRSVTFVHCGWPNGWIDQDETWHAGRPRPWPHCVRWGPSSPPPKGHSPSPPIFGPYCGQMAAWIKMSLGMELGLGPARRLCVRRGPRPLPKRGRSPQIFGPCLLRPNGWIDEDRPQPRLLCVTWRPSPSPTKRGRSPLPNFRPISIVAERLDASRCHLVWR